MKPLNQKSYGSIPHLSNSKLGTGDHYIEKGQEKILLEKKRDSKDLIYSFEKYDGSNVGICKVENKIYAITRSGYLANTSPYKQHHIFSEWVSKREKLFSEILENGERICGEWLIQVHSLEYKLKTPIVFFDKFDSRNNRMTYHNFKTLCDKYNLYTVKLLGYDDVVSLEQLIIELNKKTDYAMCYKQPEGIVFRVERNNKIDFLAKWVRQDFEAGSKMDKEIFQFEVTD